MGVSDTVTKTTTIQKVLDEADVDRIPAALALVKLGRMLSPIKVVVTGLTATATVDITGALAGATVVVSGMDALPTGEALPPILHIISLQVVSSGTAASLGAYMGIDATGGTPTLPTSGAQLGFGQATLSDDGKTLVFPNTITGFTLHYTPRAFTALSTKFDSNA